MTERTSLAALADLLIHVALGTGLLLLNLLFAILLLVTGTPPTVLWMIVILVCVTVAAITLWLRLRSLRQNILDQIIQESR